MKKNSEKFPLVNNEEYVSIRIKLVYKLKTVYWN